MKIILLSLSDTLVMRNGNEAGDVDGKHSTWRYMAITTLETIAQIVHKNNQIMSLYALDCRQNGW